LLEADFAAVFPALIAPKVFNFFHVVRDKDEGRVPRVTKREVRDALRAFYHDRVALKNSLLSFQNLTAVSAKLQGRVLILSAEYNPTGCVPCACVPCAS